MIYRNKLNYDDIGGDKRDRTADLLRARQALSQLSYIPNHILWFFTHTQYFDTFAVSIKSPT